MNKSEYLYSQIKDSNFNARMKRLLVWVDVI